MTPSDPASLEALLADCDWLRKLAHSLVRDAARAEDAVQDTLLAALRRAREGDGPPRRGWLATVLRNFVRQQRRGATRRSDRERDAGRHEPQPSAADVVERLEVQRRVVAVLTELEEPYRSVVVQRWFDGLTPREIAQRTGTPVKTVHTRLERAKAKLRAKLDRAYGGDGRSWALALLPVLKTTGMQGTLALTGGAIVSTKIKVAATVAGLAAAAWIARPYVPAIGTEPVVESVELRAPGERTVPRAPEGPVRTVRESSASDRVPPSTVRPQAPAPASAAAPIAVVTVRVRARDGGPVRARLTLFDPASQEIVAVETVAGGAATRIEVPVGRPLFAQARAVDAASEAPASTETRRIPALAAGDVHDVELVLDRGLDALCQGRIVADATGAPVEGAIVRCLWNGDELASGPSGEFSLGYSTWREARLRVDHPEFGRAYVELGSGPMALRPGAEGIHAIRLIAAAALDVWVRDASGRALAGATVSLSTATQALSQPPGLEAQDHPRWSSECREDGSAHFAALPAHAPLELEIWSAGELVWRDPDPLTLEPGARETLNLKIGRGARVHGTASDRDGRPLADRELWILPVEEERPAGASGERLLTLEHGHRDEIALAVRTDARGAYRADGLRAGTWWIGPAPIDGQPDGAQNGHYVAQDDVAPFAQAFTIDAGASDVRFDLVVDRGLYLRGRIALDEPGERLGGLSVRASHREAHGNLSVQLDEPGPFTIGPLQAGSYSVTASCFVPGVMTRPAHASARAGDTDVELALDLATTIAGTVIDAATGEPVDAHVHLVIEGSGSYGMGLGGGAGPGEFRFAGLRPGRYALEATTDDGRIGVVGGLELAAGTRLDGIDVPIAPGGRVGIRFEGPHAAVRCAILSNGVFTSDQALRHGSRSYHGVPTGPALVVVFQGAWRDRDVLAERALDVRAGESYELDFELQR